MIAILLILGGTVFGVLGGLHSIYMLLDLRNPRRHEHLSGFADDLRRDRLDVLGRRDAGMSRVQTEDL